MHSINLWPPPRCVCAFQSQSVQTLIYEAYLKFGKAITSQKIEELRNKHRRLTVHQLEKDLENSVIKNFKDNGYENIPFPFLS